MQQRFTVKDFFLFGCLVLLLVAIVLAMYMVDRQWGKLSEIEQAMSEQAKDLRDLRSSVQSLERRARSGQLAAGGGDRGSHDPEVPPAFQRAYDAAQQPSYAQGDWLVRAFGTGLKTITPLRSSDVYAAEVQSYVLESLLVRDPESLAWTGLIARDWQQSEDGLSITFQLRRNVTFSDGHPLDSSDVVFTYDFIMDEGIAAPRERAYLEKLDDVTALGPYEVRFDFEEPYFDSLSLAGTMDILPEHFYGQYLDEPQSFNQSKGLLMGSGPYRLANPEGWTPDQGLIELKRNPRYWGPVQPPFDRLLWKVIENDSARLTTFRNGEVDTYSARPREYQDLLDDPELGEWTRHMEYMSPTAGYSYIGWNQSRGGEPTRFADRRVRQAMTYLTDRQRIIEEIMLGYAEPAVSPFSPRSPQHDDALEPRSFDLGKARELLAQAGYRDRDGDGVLEGPEGKPFAFELTYFQGNEDTERIVLFLKDLYAQAGIRLEPDPSEWSVMLDKLEKKDFAAITLGWSSGVEVDIYQMFHSSQTVSGGDNFINYENPELDQIIERARGTIGEAKRMRLWHKAERILYEDQPYTFLMRRQSLVFLDQRLKNLEVTRLGLNLSRVPVEVFVPAQQQKYPR